MEIQRVEGEDEVTEPVSPTGQYLSSSVLSLSVIAVLETEVPFDDSQALTLLKDVFLPINPRFSSIMVKDKNGEKRWKKVEVRLKDHLNVPIFPAEMSKEFYDKCLDEYLSKIAMEQLPQNQPLWEVHIFKFPTSHAAGNVIFKLHHSLGDGFSLMGALLSCLQRADNPSLPLTFPSIQLQTNNNYSISRSFSRMISSIFYTLSDFCSSFVRSYLVEDDISPMRSGHPGVEYLPVSIATMTFSLDHIKQIKSKLGVTINDVISGTIFLGARLYMQETRSGSENTSATSLVLLNTRMFQGYRSIEEMVKPDAELPWGNHFTFLSISIPKLTDDEAKEHLKFIWKAHNIIKRKKSSLSAFITAKYLQLVKKLRGPEGASRYVYGTLKNTSMAITNVVGPMEKIALANQPICGLYFVVTGSPQSLMAGVISYMGKLRVSILVEKDFVDAHRLKSHIERAFNLIFEAACGTPPPPSPPTN